MHTTSYSVVHSDEYADNYINPDHVRHHRHHWISRNPAPLTALPSERQSN
ncbi:hypothetical protein G3I20_22655 [Streptomyces sp. SID8111]|nr:hypothetical protein [Streptomyces sp. SID8111]NEC29304.1 hypothetical protein [Streptomyces sp. SID8111]